MTISSQPIITQSYGRSKASVMEKAVIVFALIAQTSAFVGMSILSTPSADSDPDANVFNTLAIGFTFVAMAPLFLRHVREIGYLASKNALSLLYIFLVLASVGWSIHPDLTIRRGVGYVLSVAIPAYLVVRFDDLERMKLFSVSFAISAIGSLIYIALRPDLGIMHVVSLEGDWMGVFTHKNSLGATMAVAIFAELYILIAGPSRPLWRFLLLGLFFCLAVLSRSASALVILSIFLAAAGIYVLWKRDVLLGQAASLMMALALSLAVVILWIDPQFAFSLVGKDAGLTGRTELWDVLIPLIKSKLTLGYGYRAMWAADDPYKALVDRLTGNWGVTTAHNAFAEIALELGLVGLGIILAIVVVAFWRSIKCCSKGLWLPGWFSFAFFAATVIGGVTEDTLGMNQNLYWLMFNVLFFGCGLKLLLGQGKAMGEAIDRPLAG